MARGRRARSPPPSPRTTCSTTATRSSPAASARTTTACRCSSARSTAGRWSTAATSGSRTFFLGTDSAPHAAHLKEHAVGCAGCYTALSRARAVCRGVRRGRRARPARGLRQLQRPGFYGLPRNAGTVTLRARGRGRCPSRVPFGEADLKPLRGGETLAWQLVEAPHERTTPRVMLLIDADNVSADVIEQAIAARCCTTHGAIHVRRAYCTPETALEHTDALQALCDPPDRQPVDRQELHRHRAGGRRDRPRDLPSGPTSS